MPLLTHLTHKNILKIFASMLHERRIIFSSNQLEVMSLTAMGLYSLLYPFAWQVEFFGLIYF